MHRVTPAKKILHKQWAQKKKFFSPNFLPFFFWLFVIKILTNKPDARQNQF